eukprot:1195276-Prorocentrum_minimum.AAC.6
MEKKLKEGTTLVVDRYSFSGVAFTSAKEKEGIDLDWCKTVHLRCTSELSFEFEDDMEAPERGLIAPDCVMYLKISARVRLPDYYTRLP